MINKNEMTKIVNFMQTWRSSAKLFQPVEQCHLEQLNLFTPVFLRSELQPVLDRRARSGLGIFVTCPCAFRQRRLAQNARLVLGLRHFSFNFRKRFFLRHVQVQFDCVGLHKTRAWLFVCGILAVSFCKKWPLWIPLEIFSTESGTLSPGKWCVLTPCFV